MPFSADELIDRAFDLSPAVRYMAVYRDGELTLRERPDVDNPSSGESDKYEELLVNPTILKIAEQRGIIDCGGLRFVIVAYGNFNQLVRRIDDGHISICVGKEEDPFAIERQVNDLLERKTGSAEIA